MPLNYRKNNVTYAIEYYSDINDLNYSGLNTRKVNIKVNNVINYIGLVSSAHEQASELSIKVDNTNLRLAKKSLAIPSGLSYNSGQTVTPLISSSVSYSPTLTVGTKITYSISPSLPNGLNLNTSTGVISGTTPSSANDTTYTVTATNRSGSTTAYFRIRIIFFEGTINPKGIGGYSYDPSFSGYGYNSGYYQYGGDFDGYDNPQPVGSLSNNGSYTIGAFMVFDFGQSSDSFFSVKGNHSSLSSFTKAIVNGTTHTLSSWNKGYNSDRNYTTFNYGSNFAFFPANTSGTVTIIIE
jgi:hypothetical protein